MKDKLRKSYILLYDANGIRYIFNRSISWNNYLPKKYNKVLDLLGMKRLSHKLDEFLEEHAHVCRNIDNIEEYLKFHNTNTVIIHISDLENIENADQKELNKLKKYYCEILNAVDRKDKIDVSDNDIFLFDKVKKSIIKYIDELYDAICDVKRKEKEDFINNFEINKIETSIWKYQNKDIQQKCDNKKKYLEQLKLSVNEWENKLNTVKLRYRNGLQCCEEIEQHNKKVDGDSYFEYISCNKGF